MAAHVITFSAQAGAGGEAIAREVALRLGFRFFDRDIIAQTAAEAGISPETVAAAEKWPSFVERMLESLFLATNLGEGTGTPVDGPVNQLTLTSIDYRRIIEELVIGLAERGDCVILGHAAQVILRRKHHALRVLVHGSAERRTRRLAGEQGISLKEAAHEIQRSDRQRGEFYHNAYDVNWIEADNYDLTLGTDSLSTGTAIDLVLASAKSL